jgi:hypothetical protein
MLAVLDDTTGTGARAPVRCIRKIAVAAIFPVDLPHDRSATLFVGSAAEVSRVACGGRQCCGAK